MLLANKDVQRGLVNGSRGTVTALPPIADATDGPEVHVRFDHLPEDTVVIHHLERRVEGGAYRVGGQEGFVSREQLPLTLCYATTIHKTQGQSFNGPLEVNLSGWKMNDKATLRPLLLVALSRVTEEKYILRVRMKPAGRSTSLSTIKSAIRDILNYGREERKARYADLVRRNLAE